MDEATLDGVRADAAEARASGRESKKLAMLRESVMKSSAENGTTLLSSDTEAYEISEDVAVGMSSDVALQELDVTLSDVDGVANVVTETSDSDSPDVQGMGMAWSVKGSGTFIITLAGKGEMESRYVKSRNNAVSGSWDLMSMRRKAMGRGFEIGGYNWSVTGLYISSHVKDPDMKWVIGRWSSAPSSDTSGNCGTIDLSLGIAPLSLSFQDCDSSEIKYNAQNPGYYAAYMKQGNIFTRGARETGFHNVIKITKGQAVYYRHYQRLEMARITYPADTCAEWNSGKTC